MVSVICKARLLKEFADIQRNPPENITALPLETNILEWHYVIEGICPPYKGGRYWGKLKFPPEYPMKPPAIYMITPNGRFKTNTRLCLSMSDFHPETWNPVWSVSTILMALNSFMLDRDSTAGSIETSDTEKRRKARESMDFNCKNVLFRQLFADMTEEHLEARARQETNVPPDEVQPAPTQPALAQGVSSVTFILLSGAVCVSCVVGLWFVM